MRNRYGLDVSYFSKELKSLEESLHNRTPEELWRYLQVLAKIIEPQDDDEKVYLQNGRTTADMRLANARPNWPWPTSHIRKRCRK